MFRLFSKRGFHWCAIHGAVINHVNITRIFMLSSKSRKYNMYFHVCYLQNHVNIICIFMFVSFKINVFVWMFTGRTWSCRLVKVTRVLTWYPCTEKVLPSTGGLTEVSHAFLHPFQASINSTHCMVSGCTVTCTGWMWVYWVLSNWL
jgi:hypothetical protein